MLFSTLANPNSEKVTVCTSQEGKEKKGNIAKKKKATNRYTAKGKQEKRKK
jgi:hypothetical protein